MIEAISGTDMPAASNDEVQMRRQHNVSTRVYTVPSEIWKKIFAQLFLDVTLKSVFEPPDASVPNDDQFMTYSRDPEAKVDWSWVPMTLVCRYFHEIAVHYPRLWSIVVINIEKSTFWSKLCLSRAQSHPLVLIFRVQPSMRDALLLLPDGIDKERQMDILKLLDSCSTMVIENPKKFQMWPGLLRALPHLQHLQLSGPDHDDPVYMSQGFLGDKACKLSSMHLNSCQLMADHNTPNFPALIHLTLYHVLPHSGTLKEVRCLLINCPRLQVLDVMYLDLWSLNAKSSSSGTWPVLHELRYMNWLDYPPISAISSMMPRSLRPGQSLHISITDITTEISTELYDMTRHLMTLYQEIEHNGKMTKREWALSEPWAAPVAQGESVIVISSQERSYTQHHSLGHPTSGPGPISIKFYCTSEVAAQLLSIVDSAHMLAGIDGRIHHQQALGQNGNMSRLTMAVRGSSWAKCQQDIRPLETVLIQRGQRGHVLDKLHLQFNDVDSEESKVEVAESIDVALIAGWVVGMRWVKEISFSFEQ